MSNPQIQSYIAQARTQGQRDETIAASLRSNGWSEADIQQEMHGNTLQIPQPSTAPQALPGSGSTMWDSFQNILLFITLYVMATSIGSVLHFFVDKWIPGTPIDSYASTLLGEWQLIMLRISLAALIVSLPIFSFFFLQITNRTNKYPHLRKLKSRRFLTYATLVGTFLIMVGNVISIVFGFLSGNVTLNFVLHFVVTIAISAVVFVYYLNEVKEDRKVHA